MSDVDVLVLHGSPGSGKSTLARVIAEALRVAEVPHAVIDQDELSLVFPSPRRSFARENLAAIWPNYAAIPGLKILLPTVLADEQERELLIEAAPAARFQVCELTAPVDVLKQRVGEREPNDFWRERLEAFVDLFTGRDDLPRLRDFQVSTDRKALDATAREVLFRAGWLAG